MKVVHAFDSFTSFTEAATFIEEALASKLCRPLDFAVDFAAVLERARLIRHILGGMKNQPEECKTLILTQDLTSSSTDFFFHFNLALIESMSDRRIPLMVVRTAWKQLKKLIYSSEFQLKEHH